MTDPTLKFSARYEFIPQYKFIQKCDGSDKCWWCGNPETAHQETVTPAHPESEGA